MIDTPDVPKTLLDAVRYYSDPKICFETMVGVKWPDGKPTCPKCGHNEVYIIATRQLLQCKSKTCKKQFSVKVDTIFEDSPLWLDKWFVAAWCLANGVKVSSRRLAGVIGVEQKTVLAMRLKMELAMEIAKCKKFPISKLKTGRRTASVAMALCGQGGAKGRVLKLARRGS